jgi:hypothetical protein
MMNISYHQLTTALTSKTEHTSFVSLLRSRVLEYLTEDGESIRLVPD